MQENISGLQCAPFERYIFISWDHLELKRPENLAYVVEVEERALSDHIIL